MICKNRSKKCYWLALICLIAVAFAPTLANADDHAFLEPPDDPPEADSRVVESDTLSHTDEATGVTFTVLTETTSPKTLVGEADLITLEPTFVEIEFHGGGLSTELVTVSGLLASTEYNLYRNDMENLQLIMSDSQGSLSFYQAADTEQLVLLQAVPGTIRIRDNASGGGCNAYGTWYPDTTTCELSMNIPDSVQVTDSDITLDCKGHSITNPGGLTNGIYVRPLLTGVTVKNCTVPGFVRGIYSRSPNTKILGNTVSDATTQGIYVYQAPNSLIDDNTLDNNVQGILVNVDSDSTVVTRNTITNSNRYGVWVSSSDNVMVGGLLAANANTVSDAGKYAMYVRNSSEPDILNNTISDTGDLFESGTIGIYVSNCFHPEVNDNTLTMSSAMAVQVVDSDQAQVHRNAMNGCGRGGVRFDNSPNGASSENVATNCSQGFFMNNGSHGHVSNHDQHNSNAEYYNETQYQMLGFFIRDSNSVIVNDFVMNDTLPPGAHWYTMGVIISGYLGNTDNNTVNNAQISGASGCFHVSMVREELAPDATTDNNTFNGGACVAGEEELTLPDHGGTDSNYEATCVYFADRATGNTITGITCDSPEFAVEGYNLLGIDNLVNDSELTYGVGAYHQITSVEYNVVPTTTPVLLDDGVVGNTWLSNGDGYSELCQDDDADGICDTPFNVDSVLSNSTDHFPVAVLPAVGDVVVDVQSSDTTQASATVNPDGTTTVNVTEVGTSEENSFTVTFPEGTLPLTGDEIFVETVGGSKPQVLIQADLPPGTVKDVSVTRGIGDRVCINDRSNADLIAAGGRCTADRVTLPADGACVTATVEGDPGDNGHPDGLHDVEVCLSADGLVVTVKDMLHSVVSILGDEDGDGWDDYEDLCLGTDLNGPVPLQSLRPNHTGDDQVIFGCNASQILACKPGNNNGEQKFGLTPGSRSVFEAGTGWAAQCW